LSLASCSRRGGPHGRSPVHALPHEPGQEPSPAQAAQLFTQNLDPNVPGDRRPTTVLTSNQVRNDISNSARRGRRWRGTRSLTQSAGNHSQGHGRTTASSRTTAPTVRPTSQRIQGGRVYQQHRERRECLRVCHLDRPGDGRVHDRLGPSATTATATNIQQPGAPSDQLYHEVGHRNRRVEQTPMWAPRS